jgi:glutamate formiminotransferase/formiminotetrahydrofolate cyclodeaminase
MEVSYQVFELCRYMAEKGNPNSVTDAAVGALCARAAVHGAFLNVQINTADLEDKGFVVEILEKGRALTAAADQREREILDITNRVMAG